MANPQLENGYTSIANELLDALIAADLSGQEMRITFLIIRKTYGYHKQDDAVSLSQMETATGMSRVRCSQVVNRLQLMKILTVTENINGIGKKYKFNKDFDEWDTVKENINRIGKTKSTVKVFRNQPLRKSVTTKENITKENITKENTYRSNDFDRFWSIYPKKVGKQAALRAFKTHQKSIPPIEQILSIIDRQKQTDQWKRGFVPNPATWITQGRWEDDVTGMNGGHEDGSSRIYARQKQNIPTTARQQEIDRETERLAKEYYAQKDAAADHS